MEAFSRGGSCDSRYGEKTIAFEEQNQWDFVKVMANGVYVQEQYGADIRWSRDGIEFPTTLRRVVNSPRGFRELKSVDVRTGPIHREVEVVKNSTQFGNDLQMTSELYDEFGVPSDLQAFEPAVGKAWFNILHIHGNTNLFFDKFLIGGIDCDNDFREPDRDKLQEQILQKVKVAVDAVPANRLIVAPGCALPNDVPEFRFNTLKDALDTIYGTES